METIKFTYACQGVTINPKLTVVELIELKTFWIKKLFSKYGNRLVAPRVHVNLSKDGKTVLSCTPLATGIMEIRK